jgi:hypothetical protein
MDEQKELYNKILALFDEAERLIDTVEESEDDKSASQLSLVEPLVEQLEQTASIVSKRYFEVIKEGKPLEPYRKAEIEISLQQLLAKLQECKEKVNILSQSPD